MLDVKVIQFGLMGGGGCFSYVRHDSVFSGGDVADVAVSDGSVSDVLYPTLVYLAALLSDGVVSDDDVYDGIVSQDVESNGYVSDSIIIRRCCIRGEVCDDLVADGDVNKS